MHTVVSLIIGILAGFGLHFVIGRFRAWIERRKPKTPLIPPNKPARMLRPMPVLVNDTRLGELTECELSVMPTRTQIVAHALIPTQGMSTNLTELITKQSRVDVRVLLGGEVYSTEGRFVGATITSREKTGELTGKFSFDGGHLMKLGATIGDPIIARAKS